MGKYHDILGVAPTATDAEIKKAYLKKAKELHPDTNQGDKSKEDELKRVNEAYDNLKKGISDPDPQPQSRGNQWHQASDIFNDIFGRSRPQNVGIVRMEVGLPTSYFINGGTGTIQQVIPTSHGAGFSFQIVNIDITLTPDTAIGSVIERIMEDGSKYQFILSPSDNVADREGNIRIQVKLDVLEILTGCTIEINHPNGKIYEAIVPAGHDTNKEIRLKDVGLASKFRVKTGERGSVLISIEPVFPKLNKKQLEILKDAVSRMDLESMGK